MATIRKRGNKWQAIVRHKSIGTTAKFFSSKSVTLRWSIAQETANESGTIGCLRPSDVTVSELLERYLSEITPSKRGADVERRRLKRLIGDLAMPEVAMISAHKDPRMQFRYTHIKPENVLTKLS